MRFSGVTNRFGPLPAVASEHMRRHPGRRRVPPKTPVFICHFHFLRDLAKTLMTADYAKIRDHLARADLSLLAKGVRKYQFAITHPGFGHL